MVDVRMRNRTRVHWRLPRELRDQIRRRWAELAGSEPGLTEGELVARLLALGLEAGARLGCEAGAAAQGAVLSEYVDRVSASPRGGRPAGR